MIAVRSQPLFATRLSKRAIYERNISRCMPVWPPHSLGSWQRDVDAPRGSVQLRAWYVSRSAAQ